MAIDGFIPYGRQNIDQDDIDAVIEVLRSDWITQGPRGEEFEKQVAACCGMSYAVAFNSGTSALHASMYAAGIGPGDEVITSPVTFLATANAAVYLGARPVFVDMDINSYCVDPQLIQAAITPRSRVIIPVDYAGYPVDMSVIKGIARKHNLLIIEDAAHALGARRQGRAVGQDADMSILSFHPVKHITTGEGGMVLTDNPELQERLRQFRNHGIVRDASQMMENHGPWYYEMQSLGYNFRLSDIQSALGISQLKKLETFVKERQRIACYYDQAFASIEQLHTPPHPAVGDRHAYHLYPLLLSSEIDRQEVFSYLRERKIGVQVHYIPVHLQPYYCKNYGYAPGDFPVAEDFYRREISLPIFPGLKREEQDYVIHHVWSSVVRHRSPDDGRRKADDGGRKSDVGRR
ncbi:MAG: UDP-4-amino-4,6-dideoxy-N-acetyl-beta-L-altrosamine transaminase [Syntrophomonas sp.]|uniref:UDP-4-amino-4, 6-dideoxy-N-acetyl-beta-L-altrosamine transaminase n=1 Tax=Syntrophomonas sp. TaxID=2053627 RepID=UPI002606F4A3|nr:UDP-4-amino-4,6-dideoxy-N-acetyl-beta-L-altrosamine transaminase [Syntrophomonas sp.]MDD2511036.1 UDP-4-amino-4,6-dideoxy-N-acetyl-beta-L-altrosamine transaminase [Syntrophomonas sp.]MDD3880278.1 UDP-4-amino-4,6-dideoxy-N-acetyl-beta-L-altrosamine transaminase [Syntrophomonas sp.]MDD4627090.1 UDP-4-amino-4,6-dideoxy-N-acetyl-beta-L-altrosamine transaminase [Syntrophomonas sp.]